jgi:hypothetical protein
VEANAQPQIPRMDAVQAGKNIDQQERGDHKCQKEKIIPQQKEAVGRKAVGAKIHQIADPSILFHCDSLLLIGFPVGM